MKGVFQRSPLALRALPAPEEFAGDATEEGGESASGWIEGFGMMDKPDEDVLGEFVGCVGVRCHVEGEVEDGAGVTSIEGSEGIVVAVLEVGEKALVLEQILICGGLAGLLCQEERVRDFESQSHRCLRVGQSLCGCLSGFYRYCRGLRDLSQSIFGGGG